MKEQAKVVEIKRIVLKVGRQEVALTVEEARDLYRALGELVGPKEVHQAPLIQPIVVNPPVVAPVVVPYEPYRPWVSPFWVGDTYTTCGSAMDGGTYMLTASSAAE